MGLIAITVKKYNTSVSGGCVFAIPSADKRGLISGLGIVEDICERVVDAQKPIRRADRIPPKYFMMNLLHDEFVFLGGYLGTGSFPYVQYVSNKCLPYENSFHAKRGFMSSRNGIVKDIVSHSTIIFTLCFGYNDFRKKILIPNVKKISYKSFMRKKHEICPEDIFYCKEVLSVNLNDEIHHSMIGEVLSALDGYQDEPYIVSGNDVYQFDSSIDIVLSRC